MPHVSARTERDLREQSATQEGLGDWAFVVEVGERRDELLSDERVVVVHRMVVPCGASGRHARIVLRCNRVSDTPLINFARTRTKKAVAHAMRHGTQQQAGPAYDKERSERLWAAAVNVTAAYAALVPR